MKFSFDDEIYEYMKITRDGVKRLGQGAFGQVYLVNGLDGIQYALKVQASDKYKESE